MSLPRSSSLGRQVHLPRLADVVAEQIRELILQGDLKDGERLPPLDTLLRQFGVSAPPMREALRILEAEGLVVVQRGSVGGAVVRRPDARTAAYTVALVLRGQGTQKRDVAEALALLEPLCAGLCARRADRKPKLVRELRGLNAASRALIDGDEVAFNDTMAEFHLTLVRRCGNDTVTLLAGALGSIWGADLRSWARSTSAHGTYPTRKERLAGIQLHERVTDLIDAGDESEAAAVMTGHVDMKRIVYQDGIDPTQLVDPQAVRFRKPS
jgi:DNA-binding FadR family transcriptional regulator